VHRLSTLSWRLPKSIF